MENIKFENKDGKKKLETRCYWGVSVEQKVMKKPELLKKLKPLENIIFDDDINSSILDIEPVCDLVRMIGAGYVNGIVFAPTVMGLKPYFELKMLEKLCEVLGYITVFELSDIKVFKTYELDDIPDELLHVTNKKMLELLLEGCLEDMISSGEIKID